MFGSINKRVFDFSDHASDSTADHGGAEKFHDFLKSELIPEVELRYRANPDRRILFGQSRSGYLVLYSAFTEPDLFWGRISSNPTLSPGRKRFFSQPAASAKRGIGLVITNGSLDILGCEMMF